MELLKRTRVLLHVALDFQRGFNATTAAREICDIHGTIFVQ